MSLSERAVQEIFTLFDKFGHENYIGENVSQLQHAQQVVDHLQSSPVYKFINYQAAGWAEREGWGHSVILGAFLHDIGGDG